MKSFIKLTVVLGAFFISFCSVQAQKKKKVQTFTVSHVIQAPADKVWAVVGEDYGAIAHSHPQIVSSDYVKGTLKAGEGAERVCHFNEKGTRFLKEKQTNYDPQNYTFKNQVFQAGRFPVDPEHTYAIYRVVPIDENSSKFVFDMNYRTKPAFMGGMMKGKFKTLIQDYAIAVEHHIHTGEKVNKENFKSIKKSVASR